MAEVSIPNGEVKITVSDLKSPLVASISEDIEFLRVQADAFARGEMEKSNYEEMASRAKKTMIEAVTRTGVIKHAEATVLIKLLGNSNFTFERKEVIAVINERVAASTQTPSLSLCRTNGGARQALQSLSDGQNYLTEDLWNLLPNPHKSVTVKVSAMTEHILALGGSNLNELSLVNLISIWLIWEAMCSRCASFDPQMGYSRLQQLKNSLRTERDRLRRPHFGVVLTYPSSLVKFTCLIHFPVEWAWWVNTGPLRVQTWALRATAIMATFHPQQPWAPSFKFSYSFLRILILRIFPRCVGGDGTAVGRSGNMNAMWGASIPQSTGKMGCENPHSNLPQVGPTPLLS